MNIFTRIKSNWFLPSDGATYRVTAIDGGREWHGTGRYDHTTHEWELDGAGAGNWVVTGWAK